MTSNTGGWEDAAQQGSGRDTMRASGLSSSIVPRHHVATDGRDETENKEGMGCTWVPL
jgi:hypothetical protein